MLARRGTALAAVSLLATIACRQPESSTPATIPAAPPAGIAAPAV